MTERLPRPVMRLLIVMVMALIAIDAAPETSRLHGNFKRWIDPVMDVTGLWQTTWKLFAPDPDKINTRIEAEIEFESGERAYWRSPDWTKMSPWRRFLTFREQEYFDAIRLEANSAGWPGLAAYVARTVPPPSGRGSHVVRVTLTRLWADVPRPEPGQPLIPAGPYVDFRNHYVFYKYRPESAP